MKDIALSKYMYLNRNFILSYNYHNLDSIVIAATQKTAMCNISGMQMASRGSETVPQC